jgi:oxaloacetate decarboxylase beta subunit
MDTLHQFLMAGAFGHFTMGHLAMIIVGAVFIYLAIAKHYEPLLLVPIGMGIIIGNIPFAEGMNIGVYEEGSVLSILYKGVSQGWYPPLIFMGIGAMTDFTAMLSAPRLILLGAAAQAGIFLTFLGALALGFNLHESAAIGIIGGADGPTAIFLSSQLAPEHLGTIAIAAYSYMALVPVIQPPIIKLLTTKQERLIRMKPSRKVSKRARVLFPIVAFIIAASVAPGAITLLGMLFFGNLLKECGVTERLAATARTTFIDMITILLGLTVGVSTDASRFLRADSLKIFALGAAAFAVATACGVLFAKLMNVFSKNKINPIIGAAGVSAVPDSARICQVVAARDDPQNFVIMHAMAPNVAGVIGSAVAAGIFLATLK